MSVSFASIINVDKQHENIIMIFFVYLPQYIFAYLFLTNMNVVYRVYLIIKSRISATINL